MLQASTVNKLKLFTGKFYTLLKFVHTVKNKKLSLVVIPVSKLKTARQTSHTLIHS